VQIVLYYPNYIYGPQDSGSIDKGLKIGVMTVKPTPTLPFHYFDPMLLYFYDVSYLYVNRIAKLFVYAVNNCQYSAKIS